MKENPAFVCSSVRRLILAVALGVGMVFWPYDTRCGVGLFGYLAATGAVMLSAEEIEERLAHVEANREIVLYCT